LCHNTRTANMTAQAKQANEHDEKQGNVGNEKNNEA
jgi:hypothetical protein